MRATALLIWTASITLVFSAKAQDVHFSQFAMSPLTLNPAQIGNFDGDWRISANYRSQWRVLGYPFESYSLGYDRNFIKKTSTLSLGLLVLHDESGNSLLTSDRIQVGGAFHPISGRTTLHMGFLAGVNLKRFNIDGLTFPEQFNTTTGVFDSSLPNGENNLNLKSTKPDISAGLGMTHRWRENVFNAGFALYHLNRPNQSFFGGKEPTPVRSVFHTEIDFKLSKRIGFTPQYLAMFVAKASEMVVGGKLALLFSENKQHITSIYAGGSLRSGINRNTDALIGTVGLTFERMQIGLSFDSNVSSLQTVTNKKGAIEVALIFWSGTTLVKPKNLPCDRY